VRTQRTRAPEKVRIAGRYSEAFEARDIQPEEIKKYFSCTSIAWENVIGILNVRITELEADLARVEQCGAAISEVGHLIGHPDAEF